MTKDDKFDYFIEQTNESLRKIDEKLDDLFSFKFKLIGASVTLTIIIDVVFLYFERHT